MNYRMASAFAALSLTLMIAGCGDDGDSGGPNPTNTAGPANTPTAIQPTATGAPTEEPTAVPTATPTVEPEAGLQVPRVDDGPQGIDDSLWDGIEPFVPTLTTAISGLLYGDGQLNMSGTFDGIDGYNGGAPANLELKAVHDGQKIYILAQWSDQTFNLDRRRWLYDGPTDPLKADESAEGWTSQLNDDKIGFAFQITPASSEFGTFDNVGCASSCHNVDGAGLDMRPAEGKVDIWHWKTSRSEPLGYVDDQNSDAVNGRSDDSGVSIENRNRPAGGNNRSGPAIEWDGTLQEFTRWDGEAITLDPAYILLDGHDVAFEGDAVAGDTTYQPGCAGCHGSNGNNGFATDLTQPGFTGVSRDDLAAAMGASAHPGASAWNGLDSTQQTDLMARLRGFSGIPGYYLTPPDGSVADVTTQSNVDYTLVDDEALMRTNYRLLMVRDLDTGHDDDAQFTPGNSYPFGVALMDNDGRNHIGSNRETISFEP